MLQYNVHKITRGSCWLLSVLWNQDGQSTNRKSLQNCTVCIPVPHDIWHHKPCSAWGETRSGAIHLHPPIRLHGVVLS